MGWLIFSIIVVVILSSLIYRVYDNSRKAKLYNGLKANFDKLCADKQKENIKENLEAIKTIAAEKSIGFPWLARAYADFFHLQDLELADYLETKPHPARRAAEQIREVSIKRKTAEQLYRILKYQLEYYENLFPWLIDFKSEDIDDLLKQIIDKREEVLEDLDETVDQAKKWLTPEEYKKLPDGEKYQIALDRYWKKRKNKWEIGRDYERYIGYLYENSGYSVYYHGIVEGLKDLGRDLIAIKGDNINIIQCKCWSQDKTIHEKHIFQLFGTTVEYYIKNSVKDKAIKPRSISTLLENNKIKATLVTTTRLSDNARIFANTLNVEVKENFPIKIYPSIKCNVSYRTAEKIYHLPFDQQYDRTTIEEERNECYVTTIREAEALGFRRAFRWKGEKSD